MYAYGFDVTFDCFFLVMIIFINMKFILLLFPFIFRSADQVAQLICISGSFFDELAALFSIVGPLARQVSFDVAWTVW